MPSAAATGPPFFKASDALRYAQEPGEQAGYFIAAHTIEHTPVTVRHYSTHDVVINNQHPDHTLVAKALATTALGIPEDWPALRVSMSRDEQIHRIDSLTAPTLFAHERSDITADRYRRHRIEDERLQLKEDRQAHQRADQIDHSILHETTMTHAVQNIIDNKLASAIQRIGYSSLTVIRPLVALSWHDQGTKTVVYPYYNGTTAKWLPNRFTATDAHTTVQRRGHHRQGQDTPPADTLSRHNENLYQVRSILHDACRQHGIRTLGLSVEQLMLGFETAADARGRLPLYLTGARHYDYRTSR